MPPFLTLRPTPEDIAAWAKTREDAPARLADLIQSLISRTSAPTYLDVPRGKSINEPGADAIVDSPLGNEWVPKGRSYWNWGISPPNDKANEDFQALLSVEAAIRKNSSMVFLTPWEWRESRNWVERKTKLNKWLSVEALDSSDLAGWLDSDPATQLLLCELIDARLASEAMTLGYWWAEWRGSRWYPFEATAELVIAGRDLHAEQVRSWADVGGSHSVADRSVEETVAFIAASVASGSDSEAKLAGCVVVSTVETWRTLMAVGRTPMTLVPMFELPDIKTAVDKGHTVIQPLSAAGGGKPTLSLPDPGAAALGQALVDVGVAPDRAAAVVRRGAGSIRVTAGALGGRAPLDEVEEVPSQVAKHERPPDELRLLVAPALAGRWDDASPGDPDVVATLAGNGYQELQKTLGDLSTRSDASVQVSGSRWGVASHSDLLRAVRPVVSGVIWDTFTRTAIDTLGAPDPAWDLPPEERWMASIREKARPVSSQLRRGLAETTAILGTQPEFAVLQGDRHGPDIAAEVVGRLLRAANEDASGHRWADLGGELPLLAEAAPVVFLGEVQRGLDGRDPALPKLLHEQPGGLFPHNPAVGLLWALERLAWSRDYLSAATASLARLAQQDPGGRSGNRPAQSLELIFLPWNPQTSAGAQERLEVVRAARRIAPEVTWPLLMRMLPKQGGDIGGLTAKPEWHQWAPAQPDNRIPGDYQDAIGGALELLLEDVDVDAVRWKSLIESFDDVDLYSTALGDQILSNLEDVDPDGFSPDDKELLTDTIREEVSRHRTYADTEWALPETRVVLLERLASRLSPADEVRKHRWLFGYHPSLESVSRADIHIYDAELDRLRAEAVRTIFGESGWPGIEALAVRAEFPESVGPAMMALDPAASERALDWLHSDNEVLLTVTLAYVSARTRRDGWPWAEAQIRRIAAIGLITDRLARLLLAASDAPEAWGLAADLGSDVEAAYWTRYNRFPGGEVGWQAARKLIDFDRPFGAIQIIGTNLSTGRAGALDAETAFAALEASIVSTQAPESRDADGIGHEVAEIIEALDSADFDEMKLAGVEWVYLRILDLHYPKAVKHLFRRLATEPSFFVELVVLIYRPDSGEARNLSDEEARHVQRGFSLLRSWHGPIPGEGPDRKVDADQLKAWVEAVRADLAAEGRMESGDSQIGQALWHAPAGSDGVRPHEAVRDVIERVGSTALDNGFAVGAHNSRGVVMRGRGGDQERELAAKFRSDADLIRSTWPRVALILRGIAEHYEREGREWDRREND
jgi:hypothetical protein